MRYSLMIWSWGEMANNFDLIPLQKKYSELTRKEKQIFASCYPYFIKKSLFGDELSKTQTQNHVPPVSSISTIQQVRDFPEEAEKEGVSLMQDDSFISLNDEPTSLLRIALNDLPEDSMRAALELSKVYFEPVEVLKQIYAIEATRVNEGIKYEQELGLGLNQDTQAAINSLVNIAKTINNIQEGQKLSVNFSNNLANMITEMDLNDDSEDYDEADIIDAEYVNVESFELEDKDDD